MSYNSDFNAGFQRGYRENYGLTGGFGVPANSSIAYQKGYQAGSVAGEKAYARSRSAPLGPQFTEKPSNKWPTGNMGTKGPKRTPQTSNLQAGTGSWQPCLLTWYDPALGGINSSHGQADPHAATASGEPYDANKNTCAAPSAYPFGTLITFRVGSNSVVCRVNDRGGAITGAHFDLSRGAADALGFTSAGTAHGSFMVGGSAGSPASAAANNPLGGGGGSSITSILDLLTAPVETIGGWLASIVVNVVKDVAEGAVDYIIRPAWHWNQRAAMEYQQEMFKDKSGKEVLWTGAFWGLGYWLLFTDPNAGNAKPAPARNSRLARHARFAQSLPARHTLVKPKDVKSKTPKKPKPVTSRAPIMLTGTMSTTRHQRVKVTGTHAGNGTESAVPIKRAGEIAPRGGNGPTVTHAEPRARPRSLQNSERDSQGNTGPRERGRGNS